MTPSSTDRIAITGIGLVTSLGCNAQTSLAAIGGGIANFSEHETVMVSANEFGTELQGAIIARLPEEFVSRKVAGAERAVALLAPAIKECCAGARSDLLAKAAWYIDNPIAPESEDLPYALKDALNDVPINHLHAPDPEIVQLGRCQFFHRINSSVADLCSGVYPAVIIGAVDSLCDTATLNNFADADQLKSGTNPEGFIAGEGAGVILIELESKARSRNAKIYGFISACGSAIEAHPWSGKIPCTAQGLTQAFHQAFAQLPAKGSEIDSVIADLNGERARANEWALTSSRIFPVDHNDRQLVHPADCIGECGAAMGPALIATALNLFCGQLPAAHVAIFTSDAAGSRQVVCLQKADSAASFIGAGPLPFVNTAVVDQHNDEASFLWLLRNRLVSAPHYNLYDLARHDQRIQAHLDGLLASRDEAWKICQGTLGQGKDCYFSASFVAYKSCDEVRIGEVLDAVSGDPELSEGIISALGWLPYRQGEPWIKSLIAASSPDLQRIGIAASAIHQVDPGKRLKDALISEDPALKARALKAVGELGKTDLMPMVLENLSNDDTTCRFSAARTAALFGERKAIPALKAIAENHQLYQEQSLRLALRLRDHREALKWHTEMAADPDAIRAALIAAGIIGDPALVPWLIEQMHDEDLARRAGNSFTLITGSSFFSNGMKAEQPDDFEGDPDDDSDDVEMAPDEYLPWPDPDLVEEWWQKNGSSFSKGERYFLGKAISTTHLEETLCFGSQRDRLIAAEELAFLRPGQLVFNTRAPGFRQIHSLNHLF